MTFGEKLRNAMERLRKAVFFDKETIKEAVKEIQRELISSDVEVSLVLELSKKIEKLAEEETPGLNKREHILKKTHDLLVELIGGEKAVIPEKPQRILLVGLYGSGKTTCSGKIARYYAKRGLKPGIICADSFRAAAFEQSKQVSEKAEIPFYGNTKEKKPEKIVEEGIKALKDCNLLIVDSAGRSALDEELTNEVKAIHKSFKPEQTWLVLSADIGQIAKKQSIAFNTAIGINGVILTKMDGSSKGGGALTACNTAKTKVLFIGTGEKLFELEEFEPTRYLSRIMGYGDLQGLLEKAREAFEETELSPEELLEKEFNLNVFYQQLATARKMGPLNKVMNMLGFGQELPKELLETSEQKLDSFKIIMDSMTKKEKNFPETINHSRIQRIAKGSGKTETDVRELLKQFKAMKKMFKKFKQMQSLENIDEKKMMKLMKGIKGFGKVKKFKIK